MKKMCYEVKKFWENEDGMGVVEVVLITIVLVGLVILFKNQIQHLLIIFCLRCLVRLIKSDGRIWC